VLHSFISCCNCRRMLIYIITVISWKLKWNVSVICRLQGFVTVLKTQFPKSCCMTQSSGADGCQQQYLLLPWTARALPWLATANWCLLPLRYQSGDATINITLLDWHKKMPSFELPHFNVRKLSCITLWCPLLPYVYRYKASCARPG